MSFGVRELREALRGLDTLRYGATDLESALAKIVDVTHDLFSVDGAALMLIDHDLALRNAAVSDDRLSHLETLQIRHGTGPCIAAFDTKQLVQAEDLEHDDRWGDFSPSAVSAGLRAVLVSPIPYASDAVGVVAVFSAKPHAWTPEGELALMAFTDLAALAITTTMQSEERGTQAAQLERALRSRRVIEQAKGILVARDSLSLREAFETLRRQARSARRPIADVAADVVREAGGRTAG